jgi:histidine ammonia-lyase
MLTINNQLLTFEDIYRIATQYEKVALGAQAKTNITRTRMAIERAVANNDIIYGVTTGFGAFKNTAISPKDVAKLQENLIKSHAVGVGAPLDTSVVRAMMFLMANYLSKGYSGVRVEVVDTLIMMLNKGVHPTIPEQGSVGSSGDLAPSAHLILVAIGRGEAEFKGVTYTGAQAMAKADIKTLTLQAKEGLALINNTACMTAIASLCLYEAQNLLEVADCTGALSAEALRATTKAFDADVHRLKPHTGQIAVASHLRALLTASTMVDDERVQDQYSIRCMPQIHGAAREAFAYVSKVVNTEINSVTDNPLIFTDGDVIKVVSGGNFHGEPVAMAMDMLGIAMSELANVADRRIASLLDDATNYGLPPFLTEKGGVNSGFMILQYTTAALVSENKVLAHPSSVDSVPTSANVEDLVSMGTIGARKARDIIKNVTHVLAIECIVAAQAVDFRLKEKYRLGTGTGKLYDKIRENVPYFSEDDVYYPYINAMTQQLDTLSV